MQLDGELFHKTSIHSLLQPHHRQIRLRLVMGRPARAKIETFFFGVCEKLIRAAKSSCVHYIDSPRSMVEITHINKTKNFDFCTWRKLTRRLIDSRGAETHTTNQFHPLIIFLFLMLLLSSLALFVLWLIEPNVVVGSQIFFLYYFILHVPFFTRSLALARSLSLLRRFVVDEFPFSYTLQFQSV